MAYQKISVGISSCLLGEKVRYDGGHRKNELIINTLGKYFEFRAFCPEVAIGLGIPRQTIQLVEVNGRIHCQNTQDPSIDVTESLTAIAHHYQPKIKPLCGFIFKKGSPSCGIEKVKILNNGMVLQLGRGIFASTLVQNNPHLPIIDESQIVDQISQQQFISRVICYQQELNPGINSEAVFD